MGGQRGRWLWYILKGLMVAREPNLNLGTWGSVQEEGVPSHGLKSEEGLSVKQEE